MPLSVGSKSSLIAALIAAALIIALAGWMARPFVRLGLVAGGLPQPSVPSVIATAELSVPLQVASRSGEPVTVAVRLWYPSPGAATTPAPPLPLILYAPSWGGRRNDNTALATALAGHGFIVAAFDDIFHDPASFDTSPGDTEVRRTLFNVDTDASRQRILAVADRRVALQAAKVSAILDAVTRTPSLLPSHILADFTRIGMIGASFGGATAAETAQRDPRIRCAINLDGLLFGQAAARPIQVPFAEFNSARGVILPDEIASTNPLRRFFAALSAQEIAIIKRQLSASPDTVNLTIGGASHGDFMDELYDPGRWKQWRPWREGMIAPARMRLITDAYVAAFFNQHLNRRSAPLLRQAPSPFPEVTIEFGQSRLTR